MGRGHQHTLSMTSAGQILRQVACPARIATEERIHLFAPFPIKQGTYRIDHGSPLHRKSSPNIHTPRLFGNETFQPRRAKPPAPLRIPPPRPRARQRTEERRVGKEWVSTFRSRWSPLH